MVEFGVADFEALRGRKVEDEKFQTEGGKDEDLVIVTAELNVSRSV